MNIEIDTLFNKAITALPCVAKYTSKFKDGDYHGYVFLQPDWRRYSFLIKAEKLRDNQDLTEKKPLCLAPLLATQISKIQQLTATKNHQEQALKQPLFSLSSSNWHIVEPSKAAQLAKSLSHFVDKIDNHLALTFFSIELSFYKQSKLISFLQSDINNHQKWCYFIEAATDKPNHYQYYTLNGLSAPIHDCNTRIPVELTKSNTLDYLCFFCFFVQSEGGSFYILPEVNDPIIPPVLWDKNFIHNNQLLNLIECFIPPKVKHQGKNSSIYEATMYFDCTISVVELEVFNSGQVRLKTSKDIASALPFRLQITLS